MSLLADLLAKVKYQGDKGGVPPGLKRVVSDSSERKSTGRKLIIFSALALFAVIGGFGAVYLMEHYVKPLALKKPLPAKVPAVQEKQIAVPESRNIEVKPVESMSVKQPGAHEAIKKTKSRTIKAEQQTAEKKTVREDLPPAKNNGQPVVKDNRTGEKDSYLYSARTYEVSGNYAQALSYYKKAVEIDPENYVILNNIAASLLHQGNLEETVSYSRKALEIKKDFVPSLINLGIALSGLSKSAEGEGYLKKALSIEPSNAYALLNIGLLHERRGDIDGAYVYYFRLSETGNLQGRLGVARILEKQGRTNDAIQVYQDIISAPGADAKTKKLADERLSQLLR